jgi:hypothetical protein
MNIDDYIFRDIIPALKAKIYPAHNVEPEHAKAYINTTIFYQ